MYSKKAHKSLFKGDNNLFMRIFFSYCHKDEGLRDQLEIHLTGLKRQGVIETWHDRRIIAGDELTGAIDTHMEGADVILLLVSPDFIASDYCYDVEMTRALERHEEGSARVIPVVLRPCHWQSMPFGKLRATPIDGKPITKWPNIDDAFLDVVEAIRTLPTKKLESQVHTPPKQPHSVGFESVSPRSSNLRVRKVFNDHDKDEFLEDSYHYIAKYFESSLAELKIRNPELETRFTKIDNYHFKVIIYRNGTMQSQGRYWLNHGNIMKGICYSASDTGGDSSYNELISIDNDDQQLYLKPIGFAMNYHQREPNIKLSQEGAAEYFWEIFIERLQ